MKKLTAIVLSLILVLSLVACGEKPTTNENPSSVPSKVPESTNDPEQVEEITIEKTVLYDADGVVVTTLDYVHVQGNTFPNISVLIENNTEKNLLITSQCASVNGFMLTTAGTGLFEEVAAGEQEEGTFRFISPQMGFAGIETVSKVEFYIEVLDSNTYETLATSELITISTSATDYVQTVEDSGELIFVSNGVRITFVGLKKDTFFNEDYAVFFIENNSGKKISVGIEEVSVNGYMQDVFLCSDIRDGTMIFDGMSLTAMGFKSCDEVKNIEFKFEIRDSDTFKEIATTDIITLTFE